MRQLLIQVPKGEGRRVLALAQKHGGVNLSVLDARHDGGEDGELILVHVPNAQVGQVIDELDGVDGLRLSMMPQGVFTLHPPAGVVPKRVAHVSERSPIEIFLGGLQSIGSWKGLLSYAVAAGVVVWLGLFTNTIFLLVAAMLLAPFASPAMNVAVATARGDVMLLGHAVLRYVVALGATIVTAGVLSIVFRQDIATSQMIETGEVATPAALLAVTAGAAGALNLSLAQRNSLVSGAAVGVLVAAALAPPAGLVGMAAAIGEWDLVVNGLFLLGLQLVGLNLGGAIVFHLYGLTPSGPRYRRGRSWVTAMALLATVLGLGAFLFWQFGSPSPQLRRATVEQRAQAIVSKTLEAEPAVVLVDSDVRFTRPDVSGQHTLLTIVYVQAREDVALPDQQLRQQVANLLRRSLSRELENVAPLVDVTVLAAPETGAAP